MYFVYRFPAPGDALDAAARVQGWNLRTWPGVNDLVGIREVSGLGSYIRTAVAKPFAQTQLAYRRRTSALADALRVQGVGRLDAEGFTWGLAYWSRPSAD